MPSEVSQLRIECRIAGEMDPLAVVITEPFVVGTLLCKLSGGNDHPVIIRDRPEPLIKEPMSVLA